MEPIPEATEQLPQIPKKGKTRSRNDQRWELLRNEIFQIYMAQDNTLETTRKLINDRYGFKCCERKWKDKLKEWNFVKNLTKREMKVVVAKSEKRAIEDSKETLFFHHGNIIPPQKVANWTRKLTSMTSSPLNPFAKTPAAICYFTPIYHDQAIEDKDMLPTGSLTGSVQHPDPVNEPTAIQPVAPPNALEVHLIKADFTALPPESLISIDEYFILTQDPRPLDSWQLETLLAYCSYAKPTTHNQAIEYFQLRIEQHGKTYRFRPGFMQDFVTTHPSKLHLQELEAIVSVAPRNGVPLPDLHYTGYRALVDKLGSALVSNKDVEKAIRIAEVLSSKPHKRDKLLGVWHYDQGLYEESLPFLQSVLQHYLFEGIYFQAEPLADMLEIVYEQLASPLSWNQIDQVFAFILLKSKTYCPKEFNDARGCFQFIQPRLRTFLRHDMTPMRIASIYNALGELMKESRTSHCGPCQTRTSDLPCDACGSLLQNSTQHINELLQDQAFFFDSDVLNKLCSAMRRMVPELTGKGSRFNTKILSWEQATVSTNVLRHPSSLANRMFRKPCDMIKTITALSMQANERTRRNDLPIQPKFLPPYLEIGHHPRQRDDCWNGAFITNVWPVGMEGL